MFKINYAIHYSWNFPIYWESCGTYWKFKNAISASFQNKEFQLNESSKTYFIRIPMKRKRNVARTPN